MKKKKETNPNGRRKQENIEKGVVPEPVDQKDQNAIESWCERRVVRQYV